MFAPQEPLLLTQRRGGPSPRQATPMDQLVGGGVQHGVGGADDVRFTSQYRLDRVGGRESGVVRRGRGLVVRKGRGLVVRRGWGLVVRRGRGLVVVVVVVVVG